MEDEFPNFLSVKIKTELGWTNTSSLEQPQLWVDWVLKEIAIWTLSYKTTDVSNLLCRRNCIVRFVHHRHAVKLQVSVGENLRIITTAIDCKVAVVKRNLMLNGSRRQSQDNLSDVGVTCGNAQAWAYSVEAALALTRVLVTPDSATGLYSWCPSFCIFHG